MGHAGASGLFHFRIGLTWSPVRPNSSRMTSSRTSPGHDWNFILILTMLPLTRMKSYHAAHERMEIESEMHLAWSHPTVDPIPRSRSSEAITQSTETSAQVSLPFD